MQFPFGFWKRSATWPLGADGALLVDGVTTTLTAGSIKDYSSITVINGGILVIGDRVGSPLWTILGCSGNFTIDNTSSLVVGGYSAVATSVSTTAPDGVSLSYSSTQSVGGDAGDGDTGTAGLSAFGNGGGGGGNGAGGNGIAGAGGTGGAGHFNSSLAGGAGGLINGLNGSNGNTDNTSSINQNAYGSGGGGGSRGRHGLPLYLKVAGTISVVAGAIITLLGQDGGTGGDGGNSISKAVFSSIGGGGAGGGAGGNGGKFVVRYKTGTNLSAFSAKTEGLGNSGGNGGVASGSILGLQDGLPGYAGLDGTTGSEDIATY